MRAQTHGRNGVDENGCAGQDDYDDDKRQTVSIGLQLFLYVGGISYRKECINQQGQIAKSWSFTWFAPVPYLFRPSQPGCVVHTGTRIAFNAAGIATFTETSVSGIADRR